MNRRQFFGMTAASLMAAGLPLALLPEKKIILPPRGGWSVRIREVEQYLINRDALAQRWDLAWITQAGEYEQHYILETPVPGLDLMTMGPGEFSQMRLHHRELARKFLASKVPFGAKMVQLKLPQTEIYAAYV